MAIEESEIQTDYVNKINKVFCFIDEHLDAVLSLNKIAEVANFSPFHFHRVFKIITGETLNAYLTRRRLEKAAATLIHQINCSIAELSLKSGFTSNSSFTRAFKKFYGISPTEFRRQNNHKFSKISQLESKNGQAYPSFEEYICNLTNLKNWMKRNAKVEVKEMPKMDLAYVSSIGPQNLEAAYDKLMKWATPLGLLKANETKMVTIYHDSFKVTEADKVRMSACMVLDEPIKVSGAIGLTTLEKGKCIVGSFEIGLPEFEKSWTGLFIWMNENGYKKADKNPFEVYHNNFKEHPEGKCLVDFCIPIE